MKWMIEVYFVQNVMYFLQLWAAFQLELYFRILVKDIENTQ